MSTSRRNFLKTTIGLVSAGVIAPSFLLDSAEAGSSPEALRSEGIMEANPNLLLYESFSHLKPYEKISLSWAEKIPDLSTITLGEDGEKSLLLKGPGSLAATFLSMLPGRSYRFSWRTQRESTVSPKQMAFKFFDMDGAEQGEVELDAPTGATDATKDIKSTFFTMPNTAVVAKLVITLHEGQNITLDEIELRQSASLESFDWRYWNSWAITLPAHTTILRRNFEIDNFPTFGIARIAGVPNKAATLFVNNNPVEAADEIYFALKPHLKKGENKLELRFQTPLNRACTISIDAMVGDALGNAQVLPGDDLMWQLQRQGEAKWGQPDFYKFRRGETEQFARIYSVAPFEIPPSMIGSYKAGLSNISLPASGELGTDIPISFDIEITEAVYAGDDRLVLEWVDDKKKIAWTQYLYPSSSLQYAKPGVKEHFELKVTTDYLPDVGKYSLRIGYPVLNFGNGNELGYITIKGAHRPKIAKAQIEWDGKISHLKINGAPYNPALYIHHDYYPISKPHFIEDYVHDFAQNGFHCVDVNLRLGEGRVKDSSAKLDVIWTGPGKYNWEAVDALLSRPLRANPQAFIMLRLIFDEPKWWSDAHTEEMIVLDDGKKGPGASYASQAWRQDTTGAIRDILKYIRSKPYGSRVFGVYLTGGFDGQWIQYFDTKRLPYGFTDYSDAMQKAFRNWLHQNYQGNEKALKAAWGNPTITFATAQIPTREERLGTTYFLDPVQDQNVIDYNYCLRDETYHCLLAYCQAVKDASDGYWLAGSYYLPSRDVTYYCGQAYFSRNPAIYHQKSFDFTGIPSSYRTRPLDQSGAWENILSPELWGKMFYREQDIRTFQNSEPYNPIWGGKTAFESIAIIRRNLAQLLSQSANWYMYDMYGGWYHSPVLMNEIRRFGMIDKARRQLKSLSGPSVQIARVTSEGAFLHKRMNTQEDIQQTHYLRLQANAELLRCKAYIDTCMLEDLNSPRLTGHSIYLIDDTFYLNESQRKLLNQIKRDNNIVVFTHAIGYMGDGTISPKNISAITGINVKESDPQSDLSPMNYQFLATLPNQFKELRNKLINTTPAKKFHVDDPDATSLAQYADNGQVAAAIKSFGDWTAVYLASAFFPHQLINSLVDMGGVSTFGQIENATIVYGNGFLSVYAQQDRVRGKINLPSSSTAYDVFKKRMIRETREPIDIQLNQGQTALYFVGSQKEVEEFVSHLIK